MTKALLDKYGKALFGWGDPTLSGEKNMYMEKIGHEKNIRTYGEEWFSKPSRILPASEDSEQKRVMDELRQLMPFDKGWDSRFLERIVYGKELVRGPQNIGNCVGYSNYLLIAIRIAWELLIKGDYEAALGDYSIVSPVPFIPFGYGVGRCLVGQTGLCGGGDGSFCSVQIKGNLEYGILPSDLDVLNSFSERPQGTASIGRSWGRNAGGVLQKYAEYASDIVLKHSYAIKDTDAAWEAIVELGMPLQICSMWAFRERERITINDWTFWLYTRSGQWAHSMQIISAFEDPRTGRKYFMVGNQWGHYHKDGWWFVIDEDTLAKWLREADCVTIGEIVGRRLLDNIFASSA